MRLWAAAAVRSTTAASDCLTYFVETDMAKAIAHATAEAKRQDFANYTVYRDGLPFLIVNATFDNVRHLVERFALYEAECTWIFKEEW